MMNSNEYVDLHVHTNYSDGTFSSEEVVELAARCGLRAIAITDHDTVSGIPEAIMAATDTGVDVLPGVELTCTVEDKEIHVLGYFINWKCPSLLELLARMRQARHTRAGQMVERLNSLGVSLDLGELERFAGRGVIGRLHLANLLRRKKVVGNVQDAFRRYIGKDKPAYVARVHVEPAEAIAVIAEASGVPVLAHPGLLRRDDLIPYLVQEGIQGIEAYHSDHSQDDTLRYIEMAKSLGIQITGGSDCHGLAKGRVLMGGVKVSYQIVTELSQRRDTFLAKRREEVISYRKDTGLD